MHVGAEVIQSAAKTAESCNLLAVIRPSDSVCCTVCYQAYTV